jgi:non-haem dioxygenase in morphine synthesis N-terminal
MEAALTSILKTKFGDMCVSEVTAEEDFDSIPVIDLSPMKSSDLGIRKQLAREIYHVCANVGFFYVKV